MKPEEFVLWLSGAVDVAKGPPTPEQWAVIREKLTVVVGRVIKGKMIGDDEATAPYYSHKDLSEWLRVPSSPETGQFTVTTTCASDKL